MTDALVGYTGFVGGNLLRQHSFAGRYNRANISGLAGTSYDRLVVSAAPATMWLANRDPEADRDGILRLFDHLSSVQAGILILVSTIAVYADTAGAPDEASDDFETERAYGRNRRELESLVEEAFPRRLVLRLPALFGEGLKKNFVFDLLHPVPSYLAPDLHSRLVAVAGPDDAALLGAAFAWNAEAGMWALDRARADECETAVRLEALCSAAGISALSFTHADSRFQFYDLAWLWRDIESAIEAGLTRLNLATEPVTANDIHEEVLGRPMEYRSARWATQDMRTCHAGLRGRGDGYLYGRSEVIRAIRDFAGPVR